MKKTKTIPLIETEKIRDRKGAAPMSTAYETRLTIHAATEGKRKLIADLLGCFDFDFPDILDFGEAGLFLNQENCGYEENLLPAVSTIRKMLAKQGISDLEYDIDGYTDCDYGVYCVFEIVCRNAESYCRDMDFNVNELDFEEEGCDPEDPLEDALKAARGKLSALPWGRLDEHEAILNPVRYPYDKHTLQKADAVISVWLSTLSQKRQNGDQN